MAPEEAHHHCVREMDGSKSSIRSDTRSEHRSRTETCHHISSCETCTVHKQLVLFVDLDEYHTSHQHDHFRHRCPQHEDLRNVWDASSQPFLKLRLHIKQAFVRLLRVQKEAPECGDGDKPLKDLPERSPLTTYTIQ